MAGKKRQQEPTNDIAPMLRGNEGGLPMPFDERGEIEPLQVVRSALACINNEVTRLIATSKQEGLTPSQFHMLKEAAKTASDIAKRHRLLNNALVPTDELDKYSAEELGAYYGRAFAGIQAEPVIDRRRKEHRNIETTGRVIRDDEN